MSLLHLVIHLLQFTRAQIILNDRRNDHFGDFSIINHGRLARHTVLMYLQNIGLEECIHFCMQHRECVSISVSKTTNECELNDIAFDDSETVPDAVGWKNYYRSPMIHGGFSDWKLKTPCTAACDSGVIVYHRQCDNPRPQYGGDQCEGRYEKTEPCSDLKPCIVNGSFSDWKEKGTCSSKHCGAGYIIMHRACDNPSPRNGGKACEGETEKWVDCTHPTSCSANIALNKPSWQISTYHGSSRHAELANDGLLTTSSITNLEPNPYWEVDLKQLATIRLIKIFFNSYSFRRGDYSNLKVNVYHSGWILCKTIATAATLQIDVVCDTIIEANKIRIEKKFKTQGYFYLAEVEVYTSV